MKDPYQYDPEVKTNKLNIVLSKRSQQKIVLGVIFVVLLIAPVLVYIAFTSFFGQQAKAGDLPESVNLSSSSLSSKTTNP